MTTAVQSAERIVAYDGDCPMCTSTIGHLLQLGILKPEQTRAVHQLEQADFDSVYAAGIRNQLVVIDPVSRETRSGVDGLLWILRENTGNHFVVSLLELPGPRHLLRWGYQAISYNRRIISPPRHRIVCDCEPEVTLGRRLSLILPLCLLTILIAGVSGAVLFRAFELGTAWVGALLMVAALGSGTSAMAVASLWLPKENRIDYLGHLVVTIFVGAIQLVPASVAAVFLPRPAAIVAAYLAAVGSASLMFLMQRKRTAALSLSDRWLWAWSAVVATGVAAVAYGSFA